LPGQVHRADPSATASARQHDHASWCSTKSPALTAYRALATDRGVQGKIVLVAGGAGAVGHYAVQMAKLMGAAKVIATVSTPAKADHGRGRRRDHQLQD
jgi:NADPH:quinone reductase-like Zn-dependent oxidoreductase